MSDEAEVVIAGGGIAAAATAVRLRRLGFSVRLLVRPGVGVMGIEALPPPTIGLLEILGEPDLVEEAGGIAVGSPILVHVERLALARAFLDRARARGAVVEEVPRLPPASSLASGAVALVDATGRAAAWSRPVLTEGHDVAWQFEGRPQPDPALRLVQGDGWWAYRLGTPSTTWAGVVADAEATADQGLRRLGLDPAEMVSRGRRAARVQRAVHPVAGRRIAVGDAALAHDPIAGGGIRFALASAIAAATYDELVVGEHGRHLEARRAAHAWAAEPTPSEADRAPDVVRFNSALVETALVIDGTVRQGTAVRLPDGTLTRWLGSFDLLILARLSADPVSRLVLVARLQHEGLDVSAARAVVSWATRHGLLASPLASNAHWSSTPDPDNAPRNGVQPR